MSGNNDLARLFADLSTPVVADAALRLSVPFRIAPVGISGLPPDARAAGAVIPVRHYGSVDVFLEAMEAAPKGRVLVIDNSGRRDEACIGDLIALEAKACGLAAIVVWGCHRDTPDLLRIALPVFSYGACPTGPQRLDPRDEDALTAARFGSFTVSAEDAVFADADGVLFTPHGSARELLAAARVIWERERQQADAVADGVTLREQFRFSEYMKRRGADPTYTFRNHLREHGRAIEE